MALADSFKLTDTPYVPQYAGLPLQAVESVGDSLQQRHYDNIAKAQQLELLGLKQKANAEADADRQYIDAQLKGVKDALSTMAQSGAENATAKISNLATSFLGDEGLINIQRSIDARNREKAMLEQLGGEGIYNQSALDRFKQQGSYNPTSKRWEPYVPTAQKQLDYMKKQDEVFAPVEADSFQTGLKGDISTTLKNMGYSGEGDLANMPVYLRTDIISGITEKKIKSLLDGGAWEGYKATPEYAQQKNILGNTDEEIYNDLLTRGKAKVFNRVQSDWMRNYGFDFKAAQKGDEATIASTGEQMANEPIVVDDAVGDITQFEPKDRTTAAEFGSSTGYAGGSGPGPVVTGSRGKDYYGTVKGIPAKRWEAFNKYAKTGAEIFGGDAAKYSNLTEDADPKLLQEAAQYAKQYQQLVHDRQIFNIKDVTFTKREGEEGRSNAKDITEDVINNIRNRAIYDPIEKKMIPITNKKGDEFSEDFQDAIGVPGNITITGSIDPQNYLAKKLKNPEFADAYVATITDPENPEKSREVYITRRKYDPAQNRYTRFNRAVNDIYSSVNAEPGVEKTIDIAGRKVKAKELVGGQLQQAISDMDENSRAVIATYEMPILADIPGEGPQIFNGSKHLADYLLNRK